MNKDIILMEEETVNKLNDFYERNPQYRAFGELGNKYLSNYCTISDDDSEIIKVFTGRMYELLQYKGLCIFDEKCDKNFLEYIGIKRIDNGYSFDYFDKSDDYEFNMLLSRVVASSFYIHNNKVTRYNNQNLLDELTRSIAKNHKVEYISKDKSISKDKYDKLIDYIELINKVLLSNFSSYYDTEDKTLYGVSDLSNVLSKVCNLDKKDIVKYLLLNDKEYKEIKMKPYYLLRDNVGLLLYNLKITCCISEFRIGINIENKYQYLGVNVLDILIYKYFPEIIVTYILRNMTVFFEENLSILIKILTYYYAGKLNLKKTKCNNTVTVSFDNIIER